MEGIVQRSELENAEIFESLNNKNIAPKPSQNTIETLRNIVQPQQRTPEWYEFRQGLITASNIWKLFASDCQYNSLIYEKCQPVREFGNSYVNTESPMHWGVKYEPLTVMIYEMKNKTHVGEFGCIRHPQYSCIGASPDGINDDPAHPYLYGRMVEIKNIVNRDIDGIPSVAYWIQMQIQMETCDLDECDFVETQFKEYASAYEFWKAVSEATNIPVGDTQKDDDKENENQEKDSYMYQTVGVETVPFIAQCL
jgi:putative phage-type endonuclease